MLGVLLAASQLPLYSKAEEGNCEEGTLPLASSPA